MNMILVFLKDLKADKNLVPVVTGDFRKFIVQEDDIILKLKIENNSERFNYQIISNDAEQRYKFYIFDKSDIISKIRIRNLIFYIISGDIKEFNSE